MTRGAGLQSSRLIERVSLPVEIPPINTAEPGARYLGQDERIVFTRVGVSVRCPIAIAKFTSSIITRRAFRLATPFPIPRSNFQRPRERRPRIYRKPLNTVSTLIDARARQSRP